MTAKEITPSARAAAADLAEFVTASPSSFHAAREVARRLQANGFSELAETDQWAREQILGNRFVIRDGAIIAWCAPHHADAATPWRILGSHTDSPALKLKPQPQLGAEGLTQVGVEIYGGPLLNSWLDRELQVAGRLVLRDGREVLVATPALLRVPQLAVHLDRSVNTSGLVLDPQRHLQPVLGIGSVPVMDLIAQHAGVSADQIAGFDLVTVDAQAPGCFGANEEFFASARLDNLTSVHAQVAAMCELAASGGASTGPGPIALMVANDHEEVGSATRSGAAGPFLEDVLVRMHAALGGDEASRRRVFANSRVLSLDAGHAAHPNYPERHDPVTRPRLGEGPVLKINAQQRYATDAVGAAAFADACARAGIPHQEFVSNNAMPCGSTIGPITATRLGMVTVDAGIALLSMHSAREMCAVADVERIRQLSVAFAQA